MMRIRPRALLLAATLGALLLIGPATPAEATGTNVVPNPGFEQAGCGDSTPDICGWALNAAPGRFMSQDTSATHSGSASMALGWIGETGGEFGGWGADATTVPAFCAAIGPGPHAASFWYGNAGSSLGPAWVSLGATFYQGADCTAAASLDSASHDSASHDSLKQAATDDGWQQATGALIAPPGTESALFVLSVYGSCDNYSGCMVGANFDDLEVDDAILTTPAINAFSPMDGLVGTSVDIQGVNLSGASSVTFNGTAASFTVDSDSEIHATVPSGATTGPISVTTPNGTTTSSSSFTVDVPRLDSIAPTSGTAGASVHITGANFAGATSVTFNGTPATFTVYSNWEIFTTVPAGATTGPISVTTPTGSGSSPSSFAVITDTTPPETTITSGPTGTTNANWATFAFTASEPSSFECSIDSAPFVTCTSPENYSALADGSHDFRVRATDAAGNADPTPAERTWAVDTIPPETTITSGPLGTTSSTSAAFEFSASEPSSFECSLDSGAFASCASPKTYSGLAEGTHTFQVRATDAAGNTDPTPAQRSWTVHVNQPPTAHLGFDCTALGCRFDAGASSDTDGSIVTYTWNFGDGTSGSGSETIHAYVLPADYVVTLTVTDNDGATGTESQTVTLISLSARGYKQRRLEKVDLFWRGAGGASFDVYRNGGKLATVQGSSYTDNLDKKGPGTYAYEVCAGSVCSNTASVTF